MELSETLKEKVKQYLRSQEFFWSGGEIAEFRMWHSSHFGEFGTSPQCWRDAIIKARDMYNIEKYE